MDVIARVFDGEGPKNPQGVVDYFGCHLQDVSEGGAFLKRPGYLDQEGRVRPLVANPELWHHIG
jgi:hypothetical protein